MVSIWFIPWPQRLKTTQILIIWTFQFSLFMYSVDCPFKEHYSPCVYKG
jgi:hypothetical protein